VRRKELGEKYEGSGAKGKQNETGKGSEGKGMRGESYERATG